MTLDTARTTQNGDWYTSEPCGCEYWLSYRAYVHHFPDAPDVPYMRMMEMDRPRTRVDIPAIIRGKRG